MRIYHNIPALTAYNSLNSTNTAMEKTIKQLSTGLRINSAADDAAGFAISEKMRSQISGLEVAVRNTQDATSMLQTAEGALGETNSMLQRMRELAVQASNDTLTAQDRSYIQLEIDQLTDQIDRIANTTQFNKKRLLDGSSAGITTSSNLGVKAYVNGSLRSIDQFGQKVSFEGNYRIKVSLDPTQTGSGQVQKSSIMTIKHPNVITNVNAISSKGVDKVAVDDLPAGDYSITKDAATAGGAITGMYGLETDDVTTMLGATTNAGDLQNNASVLFEVVSVGDDSITLKATSSVLTADGDVENYLLEKIVVTDSNPTYLGQSLGLGEDTLDADGNITSSAFSFQLTSYEPANFEAGDKFVYNFTTDSGDSGVAVRARQDNLWPDKWGDSDNTSAIFSEDDGEYPTDDDISQLPAAYFGLNADSLANKEVHYRQFYVNGDNGKVYNGDIILTMNDNFASASDGDKIASFNAAYIGKTATGDTKLRDLNTFWNSSGVFMLESPQTITISQGDGKQASVTLYATDTINELRSKFNEAISVDLGQGSYVKGSGTNSFCTFVEKSEEDTQGLETVGGTFIFRSVLPGSRGDLTFSGDEDLLNTFALNVVKESSTAAFVASIYDAHSQVPVATNVKVADNRLVGILHENVDIEFSPTANIYAEWSDAEKNFILKQDETPYDAVIHIVDSSTVFQIGANEGEDIAIDIGNMTAGALGVTNVNVSTRETASSAIGKIDAAINKVSTQRAKIGAYQNALEYTSENLTTTMTNLTAAESRIRDADMAATMMEFVKLQILNQSGTSMLAQANQLPQSVLSLLQ